MDGAAEQLSEIVVTGFLSMAAYIVFKVCEYALVHDLSHPVHPIHTVSKESTP